MSYASFLLSRGHTTCVWSPSGKSVAGLLEGVPLTVTGALEGSFNVSICMSAEKLARSYVIILALPAYGHRMVLDSLVPHIEPRHTVIVSGHLSFAALYLAKRSSERSVEIPIGVWNTTLLTSKAQSSTHIRIGAIRAKVDIAVLPVRRTKEAHEICEDLFGARFLIKDDMLTVALSNLNPQNHMGIALCNLTRIERSEAWGQNTNVTPTVARLLEALIGRGQKSLRRSARLCGLFSITRCFHTGPPEIPSQKSMQSLQSRQRIR
ncbi:MULTISPECIES: NAD/NADP octopine/nopaline dehydrogenase family protein [Rhizobium/Agrobacterium group]|uniref:NAD/NADP octopine/nopaline dehydrogenase family protein n=1 Tax=Rhizobium/Agrobacterium group TaxID=227290 RepID=UPI000AD2EA26|nr:MULTISPECIES: NAD/NADP octopine/nopaline dehydrogenase family protein [Rhizobium/Agrobacterium group]